MTLRRSFYVRNLRHGRIVQGGSTITQQFVRGAFLVRSKTYARKVREAWLATELETRFSKRAILQAYLNHVYFGDGYYGVEAASRGYFGKPASQLNAGESATLAALISRPSGYGLRRTPARVRERRDWVLRQMRDEGHLAPDSMPAVPSLALGTGEVSLLNLTSAYTVFVNGGMLRPPTFIRRVEDSQGRVLYRSASEGHRVMSETTAFLMASMLADVVDSGTGYSARANGFRLPAGGKTGSTDDHNDAWFVGFTPQLAAGVWMGFDRPQPIMRRGFASVVAVPAWAGFMKNATTGNKAEWISAPAGISHIRRCRESGGLATDYCELHGEVDNDMVAIGRAPDLCPLHSSLGSVVPMVPPPPQMQ